MSPHQELMINNASIIGQLKSMATGSLTSQVDNAVNVDYTNGRLH